MRQKNVMGMSTIPRIFLPVITTSLLVVMLIAVTGGAPTPSSSSDHSQAYHQQPLNNNNFQNNNNRFSGNSENFTQQTNATNEYYNIMKTRSRDNWLEALKEHVLRRTGRTNMTVTRPDIKLSTINISAILPNLSSNVSGLYDDQITEKIRSYYPSCELPSNTDLETWKDENYMNLYFNFDYTTDINIATATLRLYRIPVVQSSENLTKSGNGRAPDCDTSSSSSTTSNEEDRLLRVSIYWYTKSMRKKRVSVVKRRLSDSKVVTESAPWVELSVRPAIRAWTMRGKNLGLSVLVEDQEGAVLKADRYFKGASCTVGSCESRTPEGLGPLMRVRFTDDVQLDRIGLPGFPNHLWSKPFQLECPKKIGGKANFPGKTVGRTGQHGPAPSVATPKPIPTIIADAYRLQQQRQQQQQQTNDFARSHSLLGSDATPALSGGLSLLPTVDVCTLEFPDNYTLNSPNKNSPNFLMHPSRINACSLKKMYEHGLLLAEKERLERAMLPDLLTGHVAGAQSANSRHIRHQRQHSRVQQQQEDFLSNLNLGKVVEHEQHQPEAMQNDYFFDPRSRIINKRVLTAEELQTLNLDSLNITRVVDR